MTTAAINKTSVTPTWKLEKVQQESVRSMVDQMGATMKVINELGPEAAKKWHHAVLEIKINHFKKLNVKTPIEMVKAMAEFEVNVFGSKIRYWGDEKEAHMEYEHCACYQAMQDSGCKPSEKEMEVMSKSCAEKMQGLATAFGWTKGEMKFPTTPNEPAVVTFIK